MPHRIHHRHHVAGALHRIGGEAMTRTVQNDRLGNAQPLGFQPLLRNLAIGDVAGPGSLRGNDRFLNAAAPFIFFFQNKTLEQLQAITLQLLERPPDYLCPSRHNERLNLTV
jgi:hypothetical protein